MEVKKSKNDGYAIGITWAGFLTTRSHLIDIPYSIDDFEYGEIIKTLRIGKYKEKKPSSSDEGRKEEL
jgi:hypothetical protein